MNRFKICLCLFISAILMTSCDKGFEVRFSNYYIEPLDTVIIGNNKIIFQGIEPEATTSFSKISKGKYSITCISRTKKKFYSSIQIPRQGSGKRTIQIDGISQISILEE
jgi:hypothetical protein